jgi:hypothetical protein
MCRAKSGTQMEFLGCLQNFRWQLLTLLVLSIHVLQPIGCRISTPYMPVTEDSVHDPFLGLFLEAGKWLYVN